MLIRQLVTSIQKQMLTTALASTLTAALTQLRATTTLTHCAKMDHVLTQDVTTLLPATLIQIQAVMTGHVSTLLTAQVRAGVPSYSTNATIVTIQKMVHQ